MLECGQTYHLPGRWPKFGSEAQIPKVDFDGRLGLFKLQIPLLGGSGKVNRRSSRAPFGPPHRAGGTCEDALNSPLTHHCQGFELFITPCTACRVTRSRVQVGRAPHQLVHCHLSPPVDTRPPTETNSLLVARNKLGVVFGPLPLPPSASTVYMCWSNQGAWERFVALGEGTRCISLPSCRCSVTAAAFQRCFGVCSELLGKARIRRLSCFLLRHLQRVFIAPGPRLSFPTPCTNALTHEP